VDKKEYNTHVENVIDILNGKYKEIAKRIKTSMLEASKSTQFEKAALFRDQLAALENLQQSGTVSIDLDIDIDIIGAHWNNELVTFHVSSLRKGKLIGGNSICVKRPLDDDLEIISAKEYLFSTFICQYYQTHEIPKQIFFPQAQEVFHQETLENIQKYLSSPSAALSSPSAALSSPSAALSSRGAALSSPSAALSSRGLTAGSMSFLPKKLHSDIKEILQLSIRNAEQKFNEQIKIDENSNQMLLALKELLNLNDLPRRIECYDISTFQGAETVAYQVVFQDGVPSKKDYKKYIIKDTLQNMDDFASLREVIRRRFHKRDVLPDLIVIDGGKPQIREVGWTLKSLGLDGLILIGLAKSRTERDFKSQDITSSYERIVVPKRDKNNSLEPGAQPNTILLKQGSPAFRLLTQLRDEAHRFAISFHRDRRDKSSVKSVLSEVKGLGTKRKKKLIESYPDMNDLLKEDAKSISEKTGIPLNVILELKDKMSILQA
jgi:excinuclease ABC subunit C